MNAPESRDWDVDGHTITATTAEAALKEARALYGDDIVGPARIRWYRVDVRRTYLARVVEEYTLDFDREPEAWLEDDLTGFDDFVCNEAPDHETIDDSLDDRDLMLEITSIATYKEEEQDRD